MSATASGQETSDRTPKAAIDNDKSTRWSATNGDSTYYVVDLGETYSVEKLYLSWEEANQQFITYINRLTAQIIVWLQL